MQWQRPFPWLAAVFAADAVATIAGYQALSQGEVDQHALSALVMVSLAGAAALFVVSWKIIDFLVGRSLRRLSTEMRAIAHGGAKASVEAGKYPALAPLPEAAAELCLRLTQARTDMAEKLDRATAKAEENSTRLAAILNDMHEGVVVCNIGNQVVLYNQVAMDMLAQNGQFGLSRSLFETVARGPVEHMLAVLNNRTDMTGGGTPFLAGSADGRLLLQARIRLICEQGQPASGYVITLVDAGPQVAALARRDALLREMTDELDETITRLRKAAGGEVVPSEVVQREVGRIGVSIRRITDGYQQALGGWWPMTDLLSSDLLSFVARHCESDGLKVNVTGLPVILHGDSQSLALAIQALIRRVAAFAKLSEIDVSAGSTATSYAEEVAPRACDEIAWLDIQWRGEPATIQAIATWLKQALPMVGGMTVRDILAHHAGAAVTPGWNEGWASLRLPMRSRVEARPKRKVVRPTRPEFYDLGLLSENTGALGGQALRSLTYVVFDTETTGLHPSAGDQIVQIGAVRIVNGRILSGESFEEIVHPGMIIPPESIQFHGITDEMVKDKPSVVDVLPRFKAFAANSVLVAHNAAFDLKFLRMRERESGVAFNNPVLDTMMLSDYLDGAEAGHSLDDICERFGIVITDRHTALGDAIVTAAVLMRQIEALEARGITTLDQAVKALDITMVLHQRQQAL